MKERPILFSAPMVRALLAGTKTQTRRAVKPQPYVDSMGNACWNGRNFGQDGGGRPLFRTMASPLPSSKTGRVLCPYGAPSNRLWVRETFVQGWPHNDNGVPDQFDADGSERPQTTWYRATSPELEWCTDGERTEKTPWRPSIHMPRAVSRITLEVVGVRVERLQDISEADAIAEGVDPFPGCRRDDDTAAFNRIGPVDFDSFPIARYAVLWESINGLGSWEANPWVWVVEFKRANA